MNEKKMSLHYYFAYRYLSNIVLNHYDDFKKFVKMGPNNFSNVLINMWKDLDMNNPGNFIHNELPEVNPFKLYLSKLNENTELFVLAMPPVKIVPEAISIYVVMQEDKARYFTIESDDTHIMKMKAGFPKEQCRPVIFIGECFVNGRRTDHGKMLISDNMTVKIVDRIKQICNID